MQLYSFLFLESIMIMWGHSSTYFKPNNTTYNHLILKLKSKTYLFVYVSSTQIYILSMCQLTSDSKFLNVDQECGSVGRHMLDMGKALRSV